MMIVCMQKTTIFSPFLHSRAMGSTKFYLAVGFIALMAVPLDFTGNSSQEQSSTEEEESKGNGTEKLNSSSVTTENATSSTSQHTIASNQAQSRNTTTNHTEKHTVNSWLDNNVTQMGVGVILLCLVISNMVLTCCICSLRRRVSYWAISRNGNPTDMMEGRYVVGDAGLPADQVVEPSMIYTMPDETAREGNGEEAHKTEGASTTEADPANGDTQSPEQAEALLPEPPADVAEPPADDVTDVLLVV